MKQREIKFRYLEKTEEGDMIWNYINLSSPSGAIKETTHWMQCNDQTTLMQFTGLLDKNGKEIYEGDLLKVEWRTANHGKYFQSDDMWNDYEETVYIEWNISSYHYMTKDGKQFSKRKEATIEIIGNIYENKDLIIR